MVGLNSLVSSTLRKGSASKETLEAEIAAESTLELGKAIILGNIALPADDSSRLNFDGTRISCGLQSGFKSGFRIQDVAGLVDLRFAPDELLFAMIGEFTTMDTARTLIADIRENAQSGKYMRAHDVLLASQFSTQNAEALAPFVTIHGKRSRLARDVTPVQVRSLISKLGFDGVRVFGASPTNSVFRVEVAAVGGGRRGIFTETLLNFEYSGGVRFKEVYETKQKKRMTDNEISRHRFANIGLSEVVCDLD